MRAPARASGARRVPTDPAPEHPEGLTRDRARGARVVTGVYAAATAVTVLLLLLAGRQHEPGLLDMAFGLLNVPVSSSLLSALVLALTTRALIARKRVGLLLVAFFQVVGIAIGVLALLPSREVGWLVLWQSRSGYGRALDTAALATGLLILAWLPRLAPAFTGRLRVRRVWWALLTLLAGLAVTLGVTACLMELLQAEDAGLGAVTRAVLAAVAGVTRSRQTGVPEIVVHLTTALVALTLLAAVVVLLRPRRTVPGWTPEQELAIRRLLRRHGERDSLGYMATRRDKEAIFSGDGRAVVTYRVVAGVALASADPLGHPDAWGSAVAAWLRRVRHEGWTPAVVSASEEGARAYAAAGLRVGRMGDEAVLESAGWNPDRPSMAPVQRAARHARRAGLTVSAARQEEMEPHAVAALAADADRWRGNEPDRGFSMALNRSCDPADGRALHVVARDASGAAVGLLSFVPWGTSGISLDVMRRSPSAPNGITELMVVELMRHARELGIRRVSLNFCMFRDTFEGAGEVDAGLVTRGLAAVLGLLDRYWQLERLYRFNRRFEPVWVPRFHCYDGAASLAQVAVAAGIAEGFLGGGRRAAPSPPPALAAADLDRLHEPEDDHPPAALPAARTQQERERHRRRQAMLEAGIDPHPPGEGVPADTVASLADDPRPGRQVELVARVRHVRDHGGVLFLTLVDGERSCQALLERDRLGDETHRLARRFLDTGDLVRVHGVLGASRTGTPSVLVDRWRTEATALRPVPFVRAGQDRAPTRDRTADLLVHAGRAALLRDRSAALAAVREVLQREGYLEVGTPVLQAVHGGATARPFETWSNAYGQGLSLRIAPELYLKRLLVAGLGPVFEIGRNFRNEGADATHNPEFTALEAYQPHGDYTTMRVLTEQVVRAAATAVHGAPVVPTPRADQVRRGAVGVATVSLAGPWAVVPVLDAVSRALGEPVGIDTDPARLVELAARHEVRLPPRAGAGAMIEEIYSELVEPVTTEPTFYVDFPTATSPLTRPHRTEPGLVERWDLVVAGMELATAYTELTDPVDQRARLIEQSRLAAAGDVEAMEVDEDFLRALELGMPPAGGLGIGLDRLVMLLTNTPIRSVLAFPFVRPESTIGAGEES